MLDTNTPLPDLLTAKEVASIFKVTPLTIKRWVYRGKLKAIRINERGDMRFLKTEIDNNIER